MTPCDRLPLILEHGAILSLSERQQRGIAEPLYGHYWGAPGRKEALADYVCCAFMPPWGMLKEHGEEFAILVLDAEPLCTQQGVLFCPTNSARSDYTVKQIRSMSEIDALDACFPNRDTYQAYRQAEILIPSWVPLFHVLGIVFCDQEARDYWMPKLREVSIPDDVLSRMQRLRVTVGQFDGFRFPSDYVVERRVRE